MSDNIHAGMLRPCSGHDVQTVYEVATRYNELIGAHQRIVGVPLVVPADLFQAHLVFRQVVDRLKREDRRMSEKEVQAIKEFANWTVEVNARMRNQPVPKVDWGD